MKKLFLTNVLLLLVYGSLNLSAQQNTEFKNRVHTIGLKDCLNLVIENSRYIKAAEQEIKIAESQLAQAKSGLYPQLSLGAKVVRTDEEPNFIFPAFKMDIGSFDVGVFKFNVPPIDVPEQNVKLADELSLITDVSLIYPLFTGGKISSYIDQAKYNIKLNENEKDYKLIYMLSNTEFLYNTVIFTKALAALTNEFLIQMETTLSLTKEVYESTTGKVTKLDYLKNKMMVDFIRGVDLDVANKLVEAETALKYLTGIDYEDSIVTKDDSLSVREIYVNVENLFQDAINKFPLNKKLENALHIYDAKLDEAYSGYYPSIAFFGSYTRIDNNYKYGIVTDRNKNQFIAGLGLQFQIFDGFYTPSKVDEVKSYIDKLKFERDLLDSNTKFKIVNIKNNSDNSFKKYIAAKDALSTAKENYILTKRAYQNDLTDVSEFISAQTMYTFASVILELRKFEYVTKLIEIKAYNGEYLNK